MRYLAMFILHWLEFDLTRANSAPVKNPANIEQIEKEISEWEVILLRSTRRLV